MRQNRSSLPRLPIKVFLAIGWWCMASGCDVPMTSFRSNALYVARLEKTQGVDLQPAVQDSIVALEELFGTPERPLWPEFFQADAELSKLASLERLQRAAGAVRSDEKDRHIGLYREHCVHCHGLTGDGMGPTSRFLNPYPRDFRLGKFKFKSTPIGRKPTRSDLQHSLTEGLAGTSMPSFRLLNDEEIGALVDYVIYLSMRGEMERQLLTEAAMELDYDAGERLYDPGLKNADPEGFKKQLDFIVKSATHVATQWSQASDFVTEVPEPPTDYPLVGRDHDSTAVEKQHLSASVSNGRKLFQGPIANCASCHGATAMGDGQPNNYDAWTKDWSEGIDPQNSEELRPLLKLGALKPRFIIPRNLRTGVYRGGSKPRDLYLRIVNGIEGTPMPATPMKPLNPHGLTETEAWDLVNFLLSLPGETITKDAGITRHAEAEI